MSDDYLSTAAQGFLAWIQKMIEGLVINPITGAFAYYKKKQAERKAKEEKAAAKAAATAQDTWQREMTALLRKIAGLPDDPSPAGGGVFDSIRIAVGTVRRVAYATIAALGLTGGAAFFAPAAAQQAVNSTPADVPNQVIVGGRQRTTNDLLRGYQVAVTNKRSIGPVDVEGREQAHGQLDHEQGARYNDATPVEAGAPAGMVIETIAPPARSDAKGPAPTLLDKQQKMKAKLKEACGTNPTNGKDKGIYAGLTATFTLDTPQRAIVDLYKARKSSAPEV